MLNTLQLVGRLADSPQSTETPTGRTAATFRLAVTRRPVNGEDRGAVFVDVECWGTLAETVARYLRRGRLVAVTGRLEQHEWHHDGARRERHHVVADQVEFLDRPPAAAADETQAPESPTTAGATA